MRYLEMDQHLSTLHLSQVVPGIVMSSGAEANANAIDVDGYPLHPCTAVRTETSAFPCWRWGARRTGLRTSRAAAPVCERGAGHTEVCEVLLAAGADIIALAGGWFQLLQ